MKKQTLLVALALTLALALGVTGCGGSKSGEKKADSAQTSRLDEVKKRGVLVAGVKDATPPFGFVDDNKQLVGFEIDLLKYIADKMGVKLELKPVTSSTRIPMLTQGSVDIVAATMTHKQERESQIDFTITHFMDGQSLLVKKGSSIKSVKDLSGKKVGTAKGSTSEKNVMKANPQAQVLSFEDYPPAFLALKQGKVEAVTTDSSILVGLKNKDENPDAWEIVGGTFTEEPYGMGVPQNDSKFRNFVNNTLIEMWRSGEYAKLYEKWMGPNTKYHIPLTWKMELWP
ncbi:MAG: ABC transporter substrate-binding protein [Humidesulfovibrio sp.]|uniref:ABC transporter substrate-binding protein n=1 Tax=Humidesulfovibrio sp. TaxID=2910988 RepID=UPI0027EEEBCE|nr:ABC transporter substrate-binding protein [Humidesulfovibrio sp.]MDQ7835100.1 ABC transporter substrate-binding protein [Humidesulfovibrio sp.]